MHSRPPYKEVDSKLPKFCCLNCLHWSEHFCCFFFLTHSPPAFEKKSWSFISATETRSRCTFNTIVRSHCTFNTKVAHHTMRLREWIVWWVVFLRRWDLHHHNKHRLASILIKNLRDEWLAGGECVKKTKQKNTFEPFVCLDHADQSDCKVWRNSCSHMVNYWTNSSKMYNNNNNK